MEDDAGARAAKRVGALLGEARMPVREPARPSHARTSPHLRAMPSSNTKGPSGCTGRNATRRDVALPVLGANSPAERPGGPPKIRKSRAAPWRAGVLIAVYVLGAIHIAHWVVAGQTISPVEPSESMYTLEGGQLNAGFIFFVAALLATLVFGRFFCGWGCHIVALQDLCAHWMKKLGARPKAFRSRLLVYVPLILALYMFVWPTFRRELLAPALAHWWPAGLAYIGVYAPFPGFTNHLIKANFWETFAGVWVAIPFLLVCGFATVYFLGAKGFCTYGCPYGGFFAPLQQMSPGRIIVDPDRCEGCGHCTAVCTSNVRVHEEIRIYGGVVDPGCMKCLDCVSVCPNDALSFRFAAPPVLRKASAPPPRHKPDLSWPEEFALAGVFAFTFFAVRGVYGVVPMLFAAGIAGCAVFVAWKLWRLVRDRDVRIIGAQLKRAGRLRPAGVGFAIATVAFAALIGHSMFIQANRWVADSYHAPDTVSRDDVFSGRFDRVPAAARDEAGAALRRLRIASSFRRGGFGLADTPGDPLRAAWLHLVRGELPEAEECLRRGVAMQRPTDGLDADLVRILVLQGRTDEAISFGASRLAEHPEFAELRDAAARAMVAAGRPDDAVTLYETRLRDEPDDLIARTRLAMLLQAIGRPDDAVAAYRRRLESHPDEAVTRTRLGSLLLAQRRTDEGARELDRAAQAIDPADAAARDELCAAFVIQLGNPDKAIALYRRALEQNPRDAQARSQYATLLPAPQALVELRIAAGDDPRSALIRSRLAQALEATGKVDEAVAQYDAAAMRDPFNRAGHWRDAAEALRNAGRVADAKRWSDKADAVRGS